MVTHRYLAATLLFTLTACSSSAPVGSGGSGSGGMSSQGGASGGMTSSGDPSGKGGSPSTGGSIATGGSGSGGSTAKATGGTTAAQLGGATGLGGRTGSGGAAPGGSTGTKSGDPVPSPGCGKATTLKGESKNTISVTEAGAGNREYYIRLPDDYDPSHPYALWFANHCLNGSAENVAHSEPDNRANYEYFGMWKLANPPGGKSTTIFVAPQGINAGWGQGAKDLAFFRAMMSKFESELCIDTSRIFASGFSMGGSMSYALACAMPEKMRAIAMYSGGSMSGCDQSKRGPVPVFISHGTEDGTCTWPGSGAPQIADLAKRDGCQAEDLAAECKPTSLMDPVCVDYKGCNPGYPARACIFKGPHIGSPGTKGTYGKNDTWVPQANWDFVKQFY